MTKIKDSVWSVFGQSIKLYFTNFGNFLKYMAFPVFGQILGIILILFASYFYSIYISKNFTPEVLSENISMVFLLLFVVTLPGILILVKAFWDFLVAYGAVNSMLDNMLKSGKVYDFHAHTEVITRRSGSFGLLWGVLAVFGIIAIFPLFWIIGGILFIYFILVFQVFAFEPQQSVFGCFKRSMMIVKGNYAKTLTLAILIGSLTYWAMPELLKNFLEYTKVIGFLAIPFDGWAQQLPIEGINAFLAKTNTIYQINSLMIAKCLVSQLLIYIITSLTLPLRVICWGLWYKALNKGEMKLDKKILDRATSGE